MHGKTIKLKVKSETGRDGFNEPIFEERWVDVENVLIGEPSGQDVIDELNLSGKMLAYILGIPKGDQHVWTDTNVRFFDQEFSTIGFPVEGIEELVPGKWHKKVKVERYG